MKKFGRVITAMVTPFHNDHSVNYKEAAKLASYLVNNGSDGLVVAGSTGEAATMSTEEKLTLFKTVVEAVGDRATIIAGTGSNDTYASVQLTREAAKAGVHGIMAVAPYYNKPPQSGMYQHFSAISQSTDLPIIVYNVPGRTGSNIQATTIAQLSQLPNIVGIKEASANLDQISEIIRTTPDDFQIYSGDDSLTLPIMAIGGCGIISVASHLVGDKIQEMIRDFTAGNIVSARKIHLDLLPLCKMLFITTNPIPIKTAMRMIGHNVGPFRLPLVDATLEEEQSIRSILSTAKLL